MRRIISTVICLALLVPLFCMPGLTASAAMKGDMDGDGQITVADALCALRIAAKLASATSSDLAAGDIDKDGQITVADALAILRVAAKLATFDDDTLRSSVFVGGTLVFGHYEQDNNTSNGKEPIEWKVLAEENGKVLLISRYGLDSLRYNNTNTVTTWSDCSLRNWLNGTFMTAAFNSSEMSKILKLTISADRNPDYATDAGAPTEDRMFLLSINEANRYLAGSAYAICKPTAYAKQEGASDNNGRTWYWLRTPGKTGNTAAYVYNDGSVYTTGVTVDGIKHISTLAVRPAFWMDMEDYREFLFTDATVVLGSYEQNNNTSDGKEPIEWQMLSMENGQARLISKYGLDCVPYNDTLQSVTWDKCSLRTWLNGTFFNSAFTAQEQNLIVSTVTGIDRNPEYGTSNPGSSVFDRVCILSETLAGKLLPYASDRICGMTDYAKARGAYAGGSTAEGKSACRWWINTSGRDNTRAVYTETGGSFVNSGEDVNSYRICVRPSILVDIGYIRGDTIKLGKYEQDNVSGNGGEDIEWKVLKTEGNKALVVSVRSLELMPYSNVSGAVTWETSSLRKWLNGTFFNSAFTYQEKQKIEQVRIVPDVMSGSGLNPGNPTDDRVFLLGSAEAAELFKSDAERVCVPTQYAQAKGTGPIWLLRTLGYSQSQAAIVNYDGNAGTYAGGVTAAYAVRPAMWIRF